MQLEAQMKACDDVEDPDELFAINVPRFVRRCCRFPPLDLLFASSNCQICPFGMHYLPPLNAPLALLWFRAVRISLNGTSPRS